MADKEEGVWDYLQDSEVSPIYESSIIFTESSIIFTESSIITHSPKNSIF